MALWEIHVSQTRLEPSPRLKCESEVLKYISGFVLSQDGHQSCISLRHIYKNDLNVLIELWPDPG